MTTALYLFLISFGLLLLLFLFIIYTWLFRYYSELKEKKTKKQLEEIVFSLFNVEDDKKQDIMQKLNLSVKNSVKQELLINIIIGYGEDFIEKNHNSLMNLYEVVGIKTFLINRLTSKSDNIKSLTCLYLGSLRLKNTEIYNLISCKNNDVRYNVLLALARFGDIKGFVYILSNDSGNLHISYRAIIEIISVFNGSKEELFEETIALSDDYVKGILIKAVADYKFESLRKYFLYYLKSNEKNIRIACIRALCELENSANEEDIINALSDKDWEVRAAAAKGLEKLGTINCFTALEKALGDREWWVRHNAASTLILIPGGKEYVSKIINGLDKYAREAVVSVIEMKKLTSNTEQSKVISMQLQRQKLLANRGYAFMELGFWHEAIEQFQKAIDVNPYSMAVPVLLMEIASSYNELGETKQIYHELEKAKLLAG